MKIDLCQEASLWKWFYVENCYHGNGPSLRTIIMYGSLLRTITIETDP